MINQFERYLSQQRMSEKTIYEYKAALSRFIHWWENHRVSDLTQDDLEAYVNHMLHTKKLSAAYINKNLAALRKWLLMLQTKGDWPFPIDLPDVVVQKKQTSPMSLQPHEVRAILYAIEQEKNDFLRTRDRCMVYLGLYRGLRNEEQMMLDTEDVILKPGKECIIIRSGKGEKYAEVDIRSSRKIISAIHEWYEERAKSQYASSSRFFISRRSGKITWGAIHKMVQRLAKRSGVDFTMHQLRHTLAHDLLRINPNLRAVQEILRHSDVKTTEIYTRQHPHEIQEALRQLDQYY